jgi:hypothetical protein
MSATENEEMADRIGHAAERTWAQYEARLWHRWLDSMAAGPDPRVAAAAIALRDALDAHVSGPDREVGQ